MPATEPTYDVTATVPGAGITRIDGVRIGGGAYSDNSIGNLWFDEVRVASSWSQLLNLTEPTATNYVIDGDNQVSDGQVTGGTFAVLYDFYDYAGVSNSAATPNFDIWNATGTRILTNQGFATAAFGDSGRTLKSSNSTHAGAASSVVGLGTYTSRWTVANSNGVLVSNRDALSNGTLTTFTVYDDDTVAPTLSGFTGLGRTLDGGTFTNNELASGMSVTGVVTDAGSGVFGGTSNRFSLTRDGSSVTSGFFTAGFSDGGAIAGGSLSNTFTAAHIQIGGAYTLTVTSVDFDLDRTGDGLGVTNVFSFTVVEAQEPGLGVSPLTLNYHVMLGNSPTQNTFTVSNVGVGTLLYTNSQTYGTGATGWFAANPTNGSLATTLSRVHTGWVASATFTAAGTYVATNRVHGNQTNAAQEVVVTLSVTNIPTPASFSVTADGAEMTRLSWSSPFTVLVVHRAGAAPSADPTNGTAYSMGAALGGGSVIYTGALSSLEHVGLANGVTHYYRIYAINNDRYSTNAEAGATTLTYQAGEIVEPASYTNAVSMDNRNGGNGWTNAWSAGAWVVTNRQPTPAALYPVRRGNSLFLATNTAGDITRSFPGVSTGRIYLSYVVSYGNNGAGTYGGLQLASNGTGRLFIGMRGAQTVLGLEESVGFGGANSAYTLSTGTNNSHTILARYDFSTRELVADAVYRTGTVPANEPAAWDVTYTVPANTINLINSVRLNFGGFDGNSVGNTYVDEIRVAQSWADLIQQYPPIATNYVVDGDNAVTDGQVASGSYTVSYSFYDPQGVTNGSEGANFDIFNTNGVQIITNQAFSSRTFADGGRELLASSASQPSVAQVGVTLGVYTSRWSAADSNGVWAVDLNSLSNGTIVTFTVTDDDTAAPIHADFTAYGRALGGATYTNNEFSGGFIVTGSVSDAGSGVFAGTSNRYTLTRDGVAVSNGAWTAGFSNGGNGSLSNTFSQASLAIAGAYTLTVFSVDYDIDRVGDETGATTTYSFAVVEAPAAPGMGVGPLTLTYHVMLGAAATSQTFAVTNIGTGVLLYTNYQTYGAGPSGWFTATPATGGLTTASSAIHTGSVNAAVFTSAGSYVATNRVDGNQTNAAQLVVATVVVTNLPTPTSVTAVHDGPEMVRLAWDSVFTNVIVVYRGGAAPTAAPTNGTVYSVGDPLGDGVVIRKTSSSGPRTFEHIAVTGGVTHYYAVYAANDNYYSTGAVVSATTLVYPAGIIEHASYTQAVNLASLTGGQGWTNGWSVSIFGGSAQTFTIYTNGTTPNFVPMPSYPTSYANRIRLGDIGVAGVSSGHASRSFGVFTNGKIYVATRLSYQFSGNNKFAGLSLLSNSAEKAFFGEIGSSSRILGIDSYGGSTVASTYNLNPYGAGTAADTGNVYLVIGSYDFSTRLLSTWAYYRTVSVPQFEGTPDATATAAVGAINFVNGIRLVAGCSDAGESVGQVFWDEIRVADSWAGLFGFTEPEATSYAIGGDNVVTDDELGDGTVSVVFTFRDPSGMTNSATRPNFDILNPSGVQVVTDQTFSAISYLDSGREQLGSNSVQPGVDYTTLVLGTYTARWSAFNSNGFSTINATTLSNGTPVSFRVVDDDFDEPIPARENLLLNPGFETNGANWNIFDSAGFADSNSLNGGYAAFITSGSSPYGGIYQDVAGSAGQVYVWSVRAKKDAGYAASNTWLKMEWKDGGFGDLGSGLDFSISDALTTNWGTFYMTATSPPGTVYARPVFINNASGGAARVYADNAVFYSVSPMRVAIGGTYFTPDGVTTNAQFAMTDGDLAGVSGASPLRLSFGAHDIGSGLARGTNEVATQMNIDVGTWLTDNNTNYSAGESTAFAGTQTAGATSVWRFTAVDADALYNAGTSRVTVTIRDADDDRTGDRLTVTNFQYGYLVVTDDDTAPPVVSGVQVNGGTNLTDAQVAGGFSLTGLVQDVGSGVNSNTAISGNDIGVNYDVWSTNGEILSNQLFAQPPTNGAGQATPAAISTLVSIAWADRVLGVHTVRVSAADNDEDRTDDRTLVVNTNALYFQVTDDDVTPPEITTLQSTNSGAFRNLHISLDGAVLSSSSGSGTNVTYTATDGTLATVGAGTPLIFWVGARDVSSGLALTNSGSAATNSSFTLGFAIVSNVANYDTVRSSSSADTTNTRATNAWAFTSLTAAEIDNLYTNATYGQGTNRVIVTLRDADFDRPADQLTLDAQQVGWLLVSDDDVASPTTTSFVVFGAGGTNQLFDTDLEYGGWSITGLVRDAGSGINVNGTTVSDPNNNISPYVTVYNNTGGVMFASLLLTNLADGAAQAALTPIWRTNIQQTYGGDIPLGIYTVRVTVADNDEDRTTDRAVLSQWDVATFTVLPGDPRDTVDGNTNEWRGVRPEAVESSTISSNEFIWRDRAFEQRQVSVFDVNNDIWEFRLSANSTAIFFYVRMQDINNFGSPYIAIGVDTDQDPADTAMNFVGDDSDTGLGSEYYTNGSAAMRYPDRNIIVHNIDGTGQRIELFAGGSWYSPPTLGNQLTAWSTGSDIMEFAISRADLQLTGNVTARFTIASFQNAQIWANDGDSTTNYSGSDAIDSISIFPYGHNAYNLSQNAYDQDISDDDIDFWFDVRIAADGTFSNAVPTQPVLAGPTNTAVLEQGRPLFTWNASTDSDDEVTSYLFEMSTNASFNGSENQTINYRVNTKHTNLYYLIPEDLGATQYYWRVRARDKSGALSAPSSTNWFQFTQTDDDTNPPLPYLVYVGTNYVVGLVQTNVTDGDLANTNDRIDFAVGWTDASGVRLTNNVPFASTNIFSSLGRIVPNWDLVEITSGNATNQFGFDDPFTNFLGYNGALTVTTIQYNAFSVTNLDINATYYLSLSAEDEDDDRGYHADPGNDGDLVPLDRSVNTNYLLQFQVIDDDTGTPQIATAVASQYLGVLVNNFLAPVASNAGTTNVYIRVLDSLFGFSNSAVVGGSGNLQNPNFDTDAGNWTRVGNPNVSWNGSAGADAGGSGGGLLFSLNHSDDYFGYVQDVAATAGAEIVFSAYMRQSVDGATDFFGTRLQFLDGGGSILQSNSSSLGVNTSTQRVEVTATAPAGTEVVRVMIVVDTPGSPPAASGYADSAILQGAGGASSSGSSSNALYLVLGGYDIGEGLSRGTANDSYQMNVDVGAYWLANNVTNYDAARSTSLSGSTNDTATSVWTFANFTLENFIGLETGGAHRVTVSMPDMDNDRTNDRLWRLDEQLGYLTFEDDDVDPPNASLIYVGTNFTFAGGYSETNRVINITDGDLVGGGQVDIAYSWYDPSGVFLTNANGAQNVFSDILDAGIKKVRNVSPNWDLTNQVTGDLGYDAIHPASEMYGRNGDVIVTMVVYNIASVTPEENEIGNLWTLTVSAQDLDDDRGNSTNVAPSLTDPYVPRDRTVRTNQPLTFTVIDDDTNAPAVGVSNIATRTDGQVRAGGWTFAWNVSDSFSGIKRGDGSANSSSNEWSPNYDLVSPSNAQVVTDRVFPNYASLNETPGANVTLSESSVPAVDYTNVVLGVHTVRLSIVDNDSDRRPGGTNVDGAAVVDMDLTTFTVVDDDTDPPGRRTMDNAAASWGTGAGNRYVIVATNETITTNRAGTFADTRYTVTDGYLANLSPTQYLQFVFGGYDTNSGLSRSASGTDTNRHTSFSLGTNLAGVMAGYNAGRSSADAAGVVLTNVWTFTNNLVFTADVISNLVFEPSGSNAIVLNMVDSDNDRTNDMTANQSVQVGWFSVADDDTRGPDLFGFRFHGKLTNVTDGDLVSGLQVTGLVQDGDSGVWGTTNTPYQPIFSVYNPTAQLVNAANLNDRLLSDGAAMASAAALGKDAANVPVNYGQRVLGVWTTIVQVRDYDNDGWGSGDSLVVVSNFTFTVVDDDTEGPLLGSNAVTRPLAVFVGGTNYTGSAVTTNAVFTLSDADLANVGGPNLTRNPWFEDGTAEWVTFGGAGQFASTGLAADNGTNGYRINTDGSYFFDYSGAFQDFPGTPGVVYEATIRARKGANFAANIADFKLEFKDGSLADVGGTVLSNLNLTVTTNWATYRIRATAPGGTVYVRPVMILGESTGGGAAPWFDFDNFEVRTTNNPMRLAFSAYDPSGLQRGNTDAATQMNVGVGAVLNANVRNYEGAESSASAITDAATNLWRFFTWSQKEISDLFDAGTSVVRATLYDTDDDRPGDSLTRSNQQFGLLALYDEDTTGPVVSALSVGGTGGGLSTFGRMVYYDFDNYDETGFDTNSEFSVQNLTAGGIQVSSGLGTPDSAAGNPLFALAESGWTTNTYLEFTLTIDAGYSLSLTNISFDERSSATGPNVWRLRYGGDSFVSVLVTGGTYLDGSFHTTNKTFNLAGLTGTHTFRLYGEGGAGGGTWRVDNLALDGVKAPAAGSGFVVDQDLAGATLIISGLVQDAQSGVHSNGGALAPRFSLYTPSNVVLFTNTIFNNGPASNGAGLAAAVGLMATNLSINTNNIVLGVHTVRVTATDWDIDRLGDYAGSTSAVTFTVLDDDTNAPLKGKQMQVFYAAGSVVGTGSGSNRVFNVNDGRLRSINTPNTNLQFFFYVDDDSGLVRGTNDPLTEMNMSLLHLVTNNVVNFDLVASSPDSYLGNDITNVWSFKSALTYDQVTTLFGLTNAVIVNNLNDRDFDRANDQLSRATEQFGLFTVGDDDNVPPQLRNSSAAFSNRNPVEFWLNGPTNLGYPGTNIWVYDGGTYTGGVDSINAATQIFLTTDGALAQVTNVTIGVWMFDNLSALARDSTEANRASNTYLSIGTVIQSNVTDLRLDLSSSQGNTFFATATNYWMFGGFTYTQIGYLYEAPGSSNEIVISAVDADTDRDGDRARTNLSGGYLVVHDDDSGQPEARDLRVKTSAANATNLTDQDIRIGLWPLHMVFEDTSGILTNGAVSWVPNYSLINPASVTVQLSRGFTIITNMTPAGTNVGALRISDGVAYSNVMLGEYRVLWSAQDQDDDRPNDRASRSNHNVILVSSNIITVIDDDTNAPSAITNVSYLAPGQVWTNVNYFSIAWTPATDDVSGVDQYRASTNAAAPTLITDGTELGGTSVVLAATITNGSFEVGGRTGDLMPGNPLSSNGWFDISSGGAHAEFSGLEFQEGTNSTVHFVDAGENSGSIPRYTLVGQDVPIYNSNDLPVTVWYRGYFRGDLSEVGYNGNQGVAFMKIEFLDSNGSIISSVDNEYDDDHNGSPLGGVNAAAWTNAVVTYTNGPANTETVRFLIGISQRGSQLAYTGYWDNLSATISVRSVTSGIFTNAAEGVITNWLFAVDSDDDRPSDRLKGPNTNFVTMLDLTAPPRATSITGTNGPDETTEIQLDWASIPHAGIRAGDGDPLSPWYSYAVFYEECVSCPVTTNSPRIVYTNGPATLATNTTVTAVLSNFTFDATYRLVIAGIDRAGNLGPLSDTTEVTTINFVVTQGLSRATTIITGQVEVAWLASPGKGYDMLYVDSYNFQDSLSNQWRYLSTVTNSWLDDRGGTNSYGQARIMPGMLQSTLRFYRVSREGAWATNLNPRRGSREVYATKPLHLVPGENWYSLFAIPDTATVAWVFGTNMLPRTNQMAFSTKISWYGPSMGGTNNIQGAETCVVWLAESGVWTYEVGGVGPANDKIVPIGQSFNIELPIGAATTRLVVIGRVPTNAPEVQIAGGTNYNFITYNVPRRLTIAQSGLKESGLMGHPTQPGRADEIRILSNSNGIASLQQPRLRIWYDSDDNIYKNVSGGANAGTNVIEPDDAVIILRRSGGSMVWTNPLNYTPPGKNFNP